MPTQLANPGTPTPAQLSYAGLIGAMQQQPPGVADPSLTPTDQQVQDTEQAPVHPPLTHAYQQYHQQRQARQSAGGMMANRAMAQTPMTQHIQQAQAAAPYVPGSMYQVQGQQQQIDPATQTQAVTSPGFYPSFSYGGGTSAPTSGVQDIRAGQETTQPAQPVLGQQADGGRTVQLIRGTQESYQHFNAKGEQEGQETATPAKVGTEEGGGFDAHGMYNDFVKAGMKPAEAMRSTVAEMDKNRAADSRQLAGVGKVSQQDRLLLQNLQQQVKTTTPKSTLLASPEEKQAHAEAQQKYDAVLNRVTGTGNAVAPEAPTPGSTQTRGPHPPAPGTKLDPKQHLAELQQFLDEAGGDKAKARQLATEAGWSL